MSTDENTEIVENALFEEARVQWGKQAATEGVEAMIHSAIGDALDRVAEGIKRRRSAP